MIKNQLILTALPEKDAVNSYWPELCPKATILPSGRHTNDVTILPGSGGARVHIFTKFILYNCESPAKPEQTFWIKDWQTLRINLCELTSSCCYCQEIHFGWPFQYCKRHTHRFFFHILEIASRWRRTERYEGQFARHCLISRYHKSTTFGWLKSEKEKIYKN